MSSINKEGFVNEKYKCPIFIGTNGRMANCSSGLLGVIVRKTFNFISIVPLLALKMHKDLSERAGWVGPTKKGTGLVGRKILFILLRYFELDEQSDPKVKKGLLSCLFYMFTRH